MDLRTNSDFCLTQHERTGFVSLQWRVFTVLYTLSPYIIQARFAFEGLNHLI